MTASAKAKHTLAAYKVIHAIGSRVRLDYMESRYTSRAEAERRFQGAWPSRKRTQFWPVAQSTPDCRNATLRRGLTFCGYPRINRIRAGFSGLRIETRILMHYSEGTKRARNDRARSVRLKGGLEQAG
jgi:hypothetical protein